MTRFIRSFSALLAALSGACADNLQIKDTNLKPTAVARVLGELPSAPSFPLELTLDGSGSSDPDGSIRSYRWVSATPQADDDAGADTLAAHRRWIPKDARAGWPDDEAQPKLTLPAAGTYAFTLWVVDDQGLVSDPSQLVVKLPASGGD